ncbi:bifunctional folylpolyglutamate synthase/dihydrofolate synthase [Synechococcus sp. RSCCF101]|uniref:bifunctional folylpolyglutamate synthase/dihydrofolate synthase n=1 Tax=Synechococcus sp. RSCCF101 TaxID=2511069 RepID=UPI0012461855|nr:bifunctional folylpolyglutamate synthase/dihydrofolate synthase [Synechococcus sp. RSCCF101]QEY30898.1 bifunctional folylpolyglutamate synthase/dihydrofolate synthase [Synechococcus sp. RSCCF101]
MESADAAIDALIEPFARRGVQLGLDRLSAALTDLGDPQQRFAALQVAGTNGKGSICALLREALVQHGVCTGLTISPHLVSWCERLQVNRDPIPAAALAALLQEIQPTALRHALTPFETVIAAAFVWFARGGVELAVLEVGLGGRLDGTTAHPQRPVLGFGSIDLDHQEHLGSTRAAIAREKAGILSPGAVAFSARQHPEVAEVLEREAGRVGASLHWVEPLEWPCGLPGAVQRSNAAVARAMLKALAPLGWNLSESLMRRAFLEARWPGRLQPWQWQGRALLLDGAHNRPAARSLRRELDRLHPGPLNWVLGILANKDGPGIVAELIRPGDRVWLVPVPGHRSWSRQDLLAAMDGAAVPIEAAATLQSALAQVPAPARGVASLASDPPAAVVAGSLYLIGSLLRDGSSLR